jgi:3D (Asp-Asp-Asp) domain-containing protein
VRQIQLLVVLSLLLSPNTTVADDKHKQPLVSMQRKARKFLAFAYSGGRLTSEGDKPVAGTTIAADPKVLPMGTRVRIMEAGKYSGVYTVSDQGSAIKGRKVDIFVHSTEEALQFGRRQVYIAVLEGPENTARASKLQPGGRLARCTGCVRKQSGAIIALDESSRSNPNVPSRVGAPGGAGTGSGGSDSRQTRNSAAFSGMSTFEGTSFN